MMKVGITGGIGSGKSTASEVFEHLGVPVYNADDHAKELYHSDADLKNGVIKLLGEEAYSEGRLNRAWVAEKVFQNKETLSKLNALVHPAVGRNFKEWMQKHFDAPYLMKEAAILFESGAHRGLDVVIHVFAPVEVRIDRVMRRDGVSEADVLARIEKQWTDEQRREKSQYEIMNDGHSLMVPQILSIHEDIIGRSNS